MSGDRLGALRAAKLRAIAGAHLGLTVDVDQGEGLADGAALASADRVAVLIGRPSRRSLGPALSWAAKRFDGADNAQALARVDLVLDPTVPVDEHPVDHDPGLAGSSPRPTTASVWTGATPAPSGPNWRGSVGCFDPTCGCGSSRAPMSSR